MEYLISHEVGGGLDLKEDCPNFSAKKLRLFTHEEDDILAGLSQISSPAITHLVTLVREEMGVLDQQVLQFKEQKLFDPRSLAAFKLAEHYCWIFAASCCLQFWYYNQGSLTAELNNTTWLHLAIQLILNKLQAHYPIDHS